MISEHLRANTFTEYHVVKGANRYHIWKTKWLDTPENYGSYSEIVNGARNLTAAYRWIARKLLGVTGSMNPLQMNQEFFIFDPATKRNYIARPNPFKGNWNVFDSQENLARTAPTLQDARDWAYEQLAK